MNYFQFFTLLTALLTLAVTCVSCTPSTVTGGDDTSADTTDIITTTQDTTVSADTTEETTVIPEDVTIRVGSYNIKHAADAGLDVSVIASVIKANKLDIVGLQEIDYCTTRSNKIDQPAALAKAADMPYYYFTRAIDYQGGGYGTLILSKYPIVSKKSMKLASGTYEGRACGHVVIDIDGIEINFLNTHLSYEDLPTRTGQFAQIAEKLSSCDKFILTGDFNTQNFNEFSDLGGTLLNNASRRYVTYPSGSSAIDNIIYSSHFTETDSGVDKKSYSDHSLLWAEFTLNP